ncbi:hypothetical protein [Tardiphaga sp. vice278]|uniref:hypothetical protein n=1 Tax=Tardiphaga sp. vice278 TaxID=2592815 RepID=UPI001162AD07|nr:hypothetical protein [Tardiphaga sp. vice278]QDM19190.1 hypothetical protein FNL53_27100 [Tardiphaga sp. vice278]
MAPEIDHWLLDTDLFFIDDNENANLAVWSKAPSWSVQEATALSYGFDPEFAEKNFLPLTGTFFVREFRERVMLAEMAIKAKKLKSPITPLGYVEWAATAGIHITSDVVDAVRTAKASTGPSDEDKPLNTQMRNKMLKIMYGMAVSKYRYKRGYGSAVMSIHDDLLRLGLRVDADTIRARLGEALDLFEGDLQDHDSQI